MAKSKVPGDVSIGKFDILATYTYARALLSGMSADEAKVRGMVAAIMGAHARLGLPPSGHAHDEGFREEKDRAERKKRTSITAESFDRQIAAKLGGFFDEVFLPAMTKLAQAGLSYDEVKKAVGISSRWGAKISGDRFQEGISSALGR
jgi:hypothetical protein